MDLTLPRPAKAGGGWAFVARLDRGGEITRGVGEAQRAHRRDGGPRRLPALRVEVGRQDDQIFLADEVERGIGGLSGKRCTLVVQQADGRRHALEWRARFVGGPGEAPEAAG